MTKKVLADGMMNASFPEDEWAREKNVVIREMAMGRDDPNRIIYKLMARTAYRVHPYRFPVIGYEEVFSKVTRDDLLDFYADDVEMQFDEQTAIEIGGDPAGMTRSMRAHLHPDPIKLIDYAAL